MGKRQYTLRGVDPELDRAVREAGERYGVSLNAAALALMKKGAGLAPDRDAPFAGFPFKKWPRAWVEKARVGLKRARRIDPELWR